MHVCQSFFLHTLGYTNDGVIRCALSKRLKNSTVTSLNKRGKLPTENVLLLKLVLVKKDIQALPAFLSHYMKKILAGDTYLAD